MNNINLIELKQFIVETNRSKIMKSKPIVDWYNKIFDKKDKYTSCGSCIRTYFKKIENYYREQNNTLVKVDEPAHGEVEEQSDNHLTIQQAGAEITVINNADVPDEVIEQSNDIIIDSLNANDEVEELTEQYQSTTDEGINEASPILTDEGITKLVKVEKNGVIKEIEESKLNWYLVNKHWNLVNE